MTDLREMYGRRGAALTSGFNPARLPDENREKGAGVVE